MSDISPSLLPSWADAIELDPRLAAFEGEERGKIVCALHGHAAVEQGFMGEWNCDRCGDVVGDSLMGSHMPAVIQGHDCPTCRDGWSKASFWRRLGVRPEGGGFLQQRDLFADASKQPNAATERQDTDGSNALDGAEKSADFVANTKASA